MINIDKDCLAFLKYTFFGKDDEYKTCSWHGYRDMCRTLQYDGKDSHTIRERGFALLDKAVHSLLADNHLTQQQYDAWHEETCNQLCSTFHSEGVAFTIGHAQKWINMMMKYLCIYEADSTDSSSIWRIFPLLHIPIDTFIMETARRSFDLEWPCGAWSKIDSYETYISYQYSLREHCDTEPLRWEFSSWLDSAN